MSARKSLSGNSFVYEHNQQLKSIYALAKSPYCTDLTSVDIATLINLMYHSDANGKNSCPSELTIAAETRLHRSTVIKSIKRLERAGVIQWTGWSKYRTRTFTLTLPTHSDTFAAFLMSPSGVVENDTASRAEQHVAENDRSEAQIARVAQNDMSHVAKSDVKCRPERHQVSPSDGHVSRRATPGVVQSDTNLSVPTCEPITNNLLEPMPTDDAIRSFFATI